MHRFNYVKLSIASSFRFIMHRFNYVKLSIASSFRLRADMISYPRLCDNPLARLADLISPRLLRESRVCTLTMVALGLDLQLRVHHDYFQQGLAHGEGCGAYSVRRLHSTLSNVTNSSILCRWMDFWFYL